MREGTGTGAGVWDLLAGVWRAEARLLATMALVSESRAREDLLALVGVCFDWLLVDRCCDDGVVASLWGLLGVSLTERILRGGGGVGARRP